MGTPYALDKHMSCHSTSIYLFNFDDTFRRITLWVLALSYMLVVTMLWEQLPEAIQKSENIEIFKTQMKKTYKIKCNIDNIDDT